MIILTKKYRLVWNPETFEIIGFPEEEHIGSETIVGNNMNSFESDDIEVFSKKLEEVKNMSTNNWEWHDNPPQEYLE